jgi:hypothetical protein
MRSRLPAILFAAIPVSQAAAHDWYTGKVVR